MVEPNGILDYGTPRPSLMTRLGREVRLVGGIAAASSPKW